MADEEMRKLHVEVPAEDLEWLEEHYPQNGVKSWFVRRALRRFRELHEIKPDELIDESVRELI